MYVSAQVDLRRKGINVDLDCRWRLALGTAKEFDDRTSDGSEQDMAGISSHRSHSRISRPFGHILDFHISSR